MGQTQKIPSQNSFTVTIVWENLIQIGSLVTEIQNFVENIGLILFDINLFEKYDQY